MYILFLLAGAFSDIVTLLESNKVSFEAFREGHSVFRPSGKKFSLFLEIPDLCECKGDGARDGPFFAGVCPLYE